MQLELALAEPPAAQAALRALWDRLDPVQREALVERLARILAKAVAAQTAGEDEHE